MREPVQHFYASSVAQWATTTDERDLRQLLKLMDKDGYSYNLFLVPLPHDAQYDINFYQPQVEGTQWLGFFEVNKKSEVHCLKCDHVWDEEDSPDSCPHCGNTDKEQTVYLTTQG